MSERGRFLWAQRWKILFTAQGIFTCGVMYKRFTDRQIQQQQQFTRPAASCPPRD